MEYSDDDDFCICELCKEEIHNEHIIGCCCKKGCNIENMCDDCATWIEEEEEWLCPKCI